MKHGFKNARLVLQSDGNLVVYDGLNNAKWSSGTHAFNNAKFKNSSLKPTKFVLEINGSLSLFTK